MFSKMINSFWRNISNFIKVNFTRTEYNSKLIDLKLVQLINRTEFDQNKLNPLSKGLLLDEFKSEYEQINLDNSNNKLQTIKNIQPLNIIRNYYINNSTWLDYLKKITFGNRYLENLNYFKFLKKNRKLNETINKNFVFNCNGKLIAFINKEEDIIISKTESNDIGFAIKSNLSLTDGIDSFSWDTISPDKLY